MREEARCVIIGGGVMGAGLLYHLAHEGWTDTVLIEKGELTSGSTWHAAGLVPNFIGDLNMAKVHQEAISLYPKIEEETGLSSGWHGCGAIRFAVTDEEVLWHKQVHAQLNQLGLESHIISPKEIQELNPLFENIDDVQSGFYTPNDGWADPTGTTNTMAKGARQLGCEVSRHNRVTDMNQLPDGRWEIISEKGKIVCEHVVNAAGCYAPQLGAMVGLEVPIVSVIHQYIITEPLDAMKELGFEPPVTRDPISSSYYRREIDGLLIGPYETAGAQAYGVDGIDWGLDFYLTPPDVDAIADCLTVALERVPAWQNAGIKKIVSGPITHTPDSGYLMGPAPGLRNYWHCNGASIGITQGPGAGKYLAQWMVHGQTEINVRGMDPRRFGDHTGAHGEFAFEKAIEEYHLMYAARPPGEFHPAARKQKVTPIYDRLDALGAQWQEVYGWERPQYFGEPEQHTFMRSNAHDIVAEEVKGFRERVGIADLTAFAKFEVTGSDAAALLDRLSANKIPGKTGGMRLVHMLTDLGGIECEMTITRFADDRFYLNSAIIGTTHDEDWLNHHILPGEDVTVADVTDQLGLLGVTGPRARDLLSTLTDADLTNASFRWLTGQEIDVAGVPCKALRVSYVGELGWELHFPLDRMPELYDAIVAAGEPHGIAHFGAYAMNVGRVEKGYKAWGSELTTEITPIEARLERFVDFEGEFIGKDVTVERRDQTDPLSMVLVYVEVDDGPSDILGNEPAYDADDNVIGIGTSGAFGHTVGKSLGFVFVSPEFEAPGTTFELDMLGHRRTCTVLAGAAHDPANETLRA
ncbi:MAG: dimethylglycine dehydrogenase [Candidatus Aldehydirespiratoraceae bacterium]|jgi:dimethylglycine dehydrogenase